MSLVNIKQDLIALRDAVVSRQVAPILRATGTVLIDAADVAELIPSFAATPKLDADKAECKALCEDIFAQCNSMQADAVGKLFPGDGTVIKIIADLVLKLLPLFI